MIAPTELAYLAGLFDGEGSVGIAKTKQTLANGSKVVRYVPEFKIGNTVRAPLDLAQALFGGTIHEQWGKKSTMICYIWRLSMKQMRTFFEAVLPYLIIKRDQAIAMIEYNDFITVENQRRRNGNGHNPYDSSVAPKQDAFYQRLKNLKKAA